MFHSSVGAVGSVVDSSFLGAFVSALFSFSLSASLEDLRAG